MHSRVSKRCFRSILKANENPLSIRTRLFGRLKLERGTKCRTDSVSQSCMPVALDKGSQKFQWRSTIRSSEKERKNPVFVGCVTTITEKQIAVLLETL